MIGILSLLLQRERMTAPELAAHFEVSRRTIGRDIDDLCRAGIPICTTQGVGGGIQIMEGYRMDRTLLSSRDMQMIMAGLRSLDSVSGSHYTSQLMEKIKAGSSDFVQGNDMILIDLSSWNKEAVSEKIELIQAAIELKQAIRFDYYAPKGESTRLVDPYYLIFKWSSWYVWGFCRTKRDFRMFKLNRMDHLVHSGEPAAQRAVPMPEFEAARFFPAHVRVKALFDPSMKWHLIESYGTSSFQIQADGTLLFEGDMDEEGLIAWLLSCRDKVTVLEPQSVREKLRIIASEIGAKYQEQGRK
ncbi:MAG: helix-turn-helix transcriptional regulator [Candidatus Ventricola sp.]